MLKPRAAERGLGTGARQGGAGHSRWALRPSPKLASAGGEGGWGEEGEQGEGSARRLARTAKLAPVLQQRVEEARAEEELLEGLLLGLAGEELVRVAEVGDVEVGLDAARRLGGHLDRVLQDGDGEAVGGHRGEPEPVVAVHRVRVPLLDNRLEAGHPRDGQVAVLDRKSVV